MRYMDDHEDKRRVINIGKHKINRRDVYDYLGIVRQWKWIL